MDAKELFGHVVRDLTHRLRNPADEYQVIRASGLLRLLLLDEQPLLTHAHPKSKIRFEINPLHFGVDQPAGDSSTNSSGMFVGHHIGRREGQPTVLLTLPEFLACPAASSSWTGNISVRHVIKSGAIAFGGVHFARPLSADEQVVEDVLRMADDGGVEDLCRLLVQIGEVVVRSVTSYCPTPSHVPDDGQ